MPELPEVETIRRDLSKKILNKTISQVEIKNDKTVQGENGLFFEYIKGNKFTDIDRVGKLLIFKLKSSKYLLIHLKMTGQLVYQGKGDIIVGGHQDIGSNSQTLNFKYARVIFIFIDNSKLFFNDLRKFGYLKIVDDEELELIKGKFGIEPLTKNFTLNNLINLLKGKKTNIKAVLLNQENIAGIGNIYVDEILFASGIKPERKTNELTKKEIDIIFKNIKKIIKKAIKWRGTTFSNYVDGSGKKGNYTKFLKVYGRKDKNCQVCNNKIKKIKLNGRGTHFCKTCQK